MVTRGITAYNPDDEFYARQALGGQAKKNQNQNQRHHHQMTQNDDDYVELVDVERKNGPSKQVPKPSSSTKSKHRRSSSGIKKKTNPSKKTPTSSSSSSSRRQSSSRSTNNQKQNAKQQPQRKKRKKKKIVAKGDESSISSNPFDIVDDDDDDLSDGYDTAEEKQDQGLGVILGCDQRDDVDDELADNPTADGCAVAAGDMILGTLLDDGTAGGDRDDGGDGSTTNFGSGYFSLDYSNQDTSYTKPTVLNTTTEVRCVLFLSYRSFRDIIFEMF